MSATLTSVLTGIAVQVGAPLVKGILERSLGSTAGGIAGSVIDAIADQAGVPVESLDKTDPSILGEAIKAVELETPDLIFAFVEQQKETNRLLLAEMDRGTLWTWAWRPFWMWFLAFLWAWALVVTPTVNAIVGSSVPLVDLSILMTLTGFYTAFYMGGHTVKQFTKGRPNV